MEKGIKRTMNSLELLREYLNLYQSMYPPEGIDFIKDNFEEMILDKDKTDIIAQIYAELGILPDESNYYLGFAKMIGERYGFNCNILEIGAGFFPILSKYIDLQQQELGCGTITAFDSCLATNKLGNIKLHKENFTEDQDVSSFDLIIATMPCDSTELIIKKAIMGQKEFFVALCGCTHFPERRVSSPYSYDYTTDSYHDRVIDLALEQEEYGFEVKIETAKQFYYKYPIISSKKI